MSSNDRPTEKELAQTYFADLIRDPSSQPDPALKPEIARLIRELVLSEQASGRVAFRQDFPAISQRIRQNVKLPSFSDNGPAQPVPTRGPDPVLHDYEPVIIRRAGRLAWRKFATLAGMAVSIALVVGILVLSLAAVGGNPGVTPATGAGPARVATKTIQSQTTPSPTSVPSPSPTSQMKPTSKGVDDLLNLKTYIPSVLIDVAKSISLDQAVLQKQMQSGMTLAEIAKQKGFTLDQLKAIMLDSFKSQIQVEKNNGLLTQAEADELYQACSGFIDSYLTSPPGSTVIKIGPTPSI